MRRIKGHTPHGGYAMKYIHEHKDFPKFTWSDDIYTLLSDVIKIESEYFTNLKLFNFNEKQESILLNLSDEIISSSAIEGEKINKNEVRSSLIKHLGFDLKRNSTSRFVEDIVEMTMDAIDNLSPLTHERLFNWHRFLFPNGYSGMHKIITGAYRKNEMRVVSTKGRREIIHFEAVKAKEVQKLMNDFIHWINDNNIHPFIKAAVAQLYFLTIHPFDDGNGRIARNITQHLLVKSEGEFIKYVSLSKQINFEKEIYYDILETTQKGSLNITPWLDWFLNCFKRALESSTKTLNLVMRKTVFWIHNKDQVMDARQVKIINMLFDGFEGNLTTSKFAKIAKISQDTATRLINDLIEKQILEKNGKGRNTHYLLKET